MLLLNRSFKQTSLRQKSNELYPEVSIHRLFKYRYREPHTVIDVKQTLHFEMKVICISLIQLTARSRTAPWRDLKGQAPILKLRKKQQHTRSNEKQSLYQWNPKYSRIEAVKQADLFNFLVEENYEMQ